MGNGGMVPGQGAGFKSQVNGTFNAFTASRLVTSWFQKVEELKEYETTEISNIAISVIDDYLSNYFNETDDLVTFISDDPKVKEFERRINKIFSDIKLATTVKEHRKEIIYYGSYSVKVDWNSTQRKWIKYELQNPYTVISVRSQGSTKLHLVLSKQGQLIKTAPHAILRIGMPGMHLINDLGDEVVDPNYDKYKAQQLEDTLISSFDLVGGYPLYYNLIGKIKEYLLKDQLVSLLSIKDLIQPLLLLIRVDKGTDPGEANNLAVNTENLINKYSDLSAIFGANFSIMDLMDSVLNNIRVLPDYNSAIGDMNSVDLSKISSKIQEIKGDQDSLREQIYTTIGIPRSLYAGDSTKWDAIKSSQRLQSTISGLIKDICFSISIIAANFYYLLTKETFDPNNIKVNLFKKTDADYNIAITGADIVNQLLDSVNRVLESAQRFMQDTKIADRNAYIKYVKDQLSSIDPNFMEVVTDEMINKYIDDLKKQDSDGGGFGGGSRW
jgi:hypothetical protein